MKNYTGFLEDIKLHFNYLIEEFGFKITKLVDMSEQMYIKVEYSSLTTLFIIVISRDEISTIFKPIDEPETSSLSLYLIFEYFSKIDNQSIYVMPDFNNINKTLELLANKMKEYCIPFLIGDYSQWNKLLLWFYNKSRKEYYDLTGKILPDSELAEYLRMKKMLK